ncbi:MULTISPECIES: recombinase family protein [Mycolicibacterium]|uniref:Resolvase, N-terminal domain n=2 Tax=Mycolicibacterium TaxID=1866885 RepID=A1TDT0_MYCVP|nr:MULTISPECIES: recombinase family protein [Mycolicibacterium]ABM15330.1 Resolvase, N-terminal domain [Mycolicibacterium vanbaalenii PYR-1]MCV7129368.1 recombinase family protein [Mycolicibacterium vanbaalenii PYR-1]MDN4520949.1 recombinase family protein [Mycolicibacterium austroafricanum]MDW5610488.1 recombinase family protein [Mycolicibacterium sp. D5.8-2]QRZ05598.1 recombinase family protein [Mycolicibacterium austroafricanum]
MTVTLGYATAVKGCADLDGQLAELAAAGVDPRRIFTDRTAGSADKMRAGLLALLSYARSGDVVVVVALDRLGRSVAEVTKTVADLTRRGITLRCLRNGLDTATSTGRIVADVLTDLAGLDAVSTTEVRP